MMTTRWSKSKVMTESLMPSPHKRVHAKRDSGSTKMNYNGKWTNSQENSISKTTLMPLRSRRSSELHCQEFTHGNSLTNHSHSQDSEDTNSFKRTWTCLSTSKTTSTPTSPTQLTLPISSRSERLLFRTF